MDHAQSGTYQILKQNSLKNSLLPIVAPEGVLAKVLAAGTSDLPKQTLTTPSGKKVEFPVDGFSKHCPGEGRGRAAWPYCSACRRAGAPRHHIAPETGTPSDPGGTAGAGLAWLGRPR